MAAPMQLRPSLQVNGSVKSSFRGITSGLQQLNIANAAIGRSTRLNVEGKRVW